MRRNVTQKSIGNAAPASPIERVGERDELFAAHLWCLPQCMWPAHSLPSLTGRRRAERFEERHHALSRGKWRSRRLWARLTQHRSGLSVVVVSRVEIALIEIADPLIVCIQRVFLSKFKPHYSLRALIGHAVATEQHVSQQSLR